MKKNIKLLMPLLVLITANSLLAAQDDSSGGIVYLGLTKKVSTASRMEENIFLSNRSVSLIDLTQIDAKNYKPLPDLLNGSAGIFTQKTTYGHGSPILRGFIGRENLILVDGVRLNNSTYRSGAVQYLNTIDSNQIDRIEIVRGTGSVLYGSDALGGVINIITKSQKDFSNNTSSEREIIANYSTADQGYLGRFGINGNFARFGYVAGISYKKTGDITAGGTLGVEKPTAFEDQDHDVKLQFRLDAEQELKLSYQSVFQPSVPRYDKYLGSREYIAQTYSKFLYEPQVRKLWNLEYDNNAGSKYFDSIRANVSYHDQSETRKEQKNNSAIISEFNDYNKTAGISLQLASTLYERNKLAYGAEYYKDDIESRASNFNTLTNLTSDNSANSAFPNGSKYDSLGIYLQDMVDLNDMFTLTIGSRYSKTSLESILRNSPLTGDLSMQFENLIGDLGLSYRIDEMYNIVLNVAQGFRSPNLDDTVTLQTTATGVDVPSPGLSPEKNLNYEIGLKYNGLMAWSIFCFYNDLTDRIVRKSGFYQGLNFIDTNGNGIKDSSEAFVFQKFNVGKARVFGFEIENAYLFLRDWTLSSSVSFAKGENITDNEPLSRIPPLNGFLGLKWQMPSNTYWSEFYVLAAAKQDLLSVQDLKDPRISPTGTPGWATINIRGGIEFNKNISASMTVENILDEPYRMHGSGIDGSGRNVILSLHSKF